ncbi:MAG: ribonuclease III [Dehalococcoidales bacterium]|nr:ribonuclease III [Dehalococcoidales bacterium]
MADFRLIQDKIGITFDNPALLELALVHSSYINENPEKAPASNERLEFLGDAVLGLIIAERLYQMYPDSPEGDLTRFRSSLVRRETLSDIARSIELGKYLFLGNGEEAGGGRDKPANLAGAFEALIASIYLDKGLKPAEDFILSLFSADISKQAITGVVTDYKSRLQEIIQAEQQITPEYHLVSATGPDHDRQFTVEVRIRNNIMGLGKGKSKKAAEMEAARIALESHKDYRD